MDHWRVNLTFTEQWSTHVNSKASILPQWNPNESLNQSTSLFHYPHYLYQPNLMTLDKETWFLQNQLTDNSMVKKLMRLQNL